MISRLTAFATLFSIAAAASLTLAAGAHQGTPSVATSAAAKQVRIVQLERVVIVGKRLPRQAI